MHSAQLTELLNEIVLLRDSSIRGCVSTMAAVTETSIIHIKLVPAETVEEQKQNIIANVVIDGHGSTLPYIDDAIITTKVSKLGETKSEEQPRLRYYAVGPSTYRIRCPLCRQDGNAAVLRKGGFKDISCCLSMLSCCFPIFWICCLCTWCGCNQECSTKDCYCNKCGGKLGIQQN
ncbi:uncharacterized protein LOC119683210 [Teleopsis dalmanni]|uniref:uncharacterized protein LOC119683210 n=1 Tax=Teleopsis dalmanni TaxID=139649 RepID=UPI0018CE5067|nr:uncharacterized protein LOC119683210 [Teleopsis dalmanni]